MAKKELGYVELEWKCPQCETMNPGPQKFCSGCGAMQPQGVSFQQKAEEKLITDKAEIARAKAGPDVHCAFCGARNPATAKRCTQCGASLETATARESGKVLGGHRDQAAAPVACPQCGTLNPATASRCSACNASLKRPEPRARPAQAASKDAAEKRKPSPLLIVVAGVGLLAVMAVCVLIALSMTSKEEVVGTVSAVSWERSIAIEELGPVNRSGWIDDIPAQATLGTCTQKMHHVQDDPAPGAKEVCGTPYTVDTGTGYGEVVQDCQYEVYQDWCEYTVWEWIMVDTVRVFGSDTDPVWPVLNLGPDQRQGTPTETYQVEFRTENRDYTYTTSNLDQFRQFQVGGRWELEISVLGRVKPIGRAQ